MKPNFFILGAPKCGTTSLADWLRGHPQVFMSDPKEPHYFNTDSKHHAVFSLTQYEALFDKANAVQSAVGEASVWYLVSDTAVNNILEYQPNAKFIVCLRNPIEACVSLHDQKVFSGDENIKDFRLAWGMQDARSRGDVALPPTCMDVRQLLYGESCLFGSLLNKLHKKVRKDQLLVILMDEIKEDPREVYQKVLAHIEVADDGKKTFTPSNRAKQRKQLWLRRLLRRVTLLKGRFHFTGGTGLGAVINKWNTVERPRKQLDADVHTMLVDYFSSDIDLLQELLGKDLQYWKASQ